MRVTAIAATITFLVAGAVTGAGSAAGSSPPALYSGAQAAMGSKEYDQNCSQCHGANLEGGAGPALSGQNLRTLAKSTKLTVADLYDFMRQQMPMNAPASLPKQQYLAILAYILKFNGYPSGSTSLTASAADASKVIVTSYK